MNPAQSQTFIELTVIMELLGVAQHILGRIADHDQQHPTQQKMASDLVAQASRSARIYRDLLS